MLLHKMISCGSGRILRRRLNSSFSPFHIISNSRHAGLTHTFWTFGNPPLAPFLPDRRPLLGSTGASLGSSRRHLGTQKALYPPRFRGYDGSDRPVPTNPSRVPTKRSRWQNEHPIALGPRHDAKRSPPCPRFVELKPNPT